jgi:hypothetical protein
MRASDPSSERGCATRHSLLSDFFDDPKGGSGKCSMPGGLFCSPPLSHLHPVFHGFPMFRFNAPFFPQFTNQLDRHTFLDPPTKILDWPQNIVELHAILSSRKILPPRFFLVALYERITRQHWRPHRLPARNVHRLFLARLPRHES